MRLIAKAFSTTSLVVFTALAAGPVRAADVTASSGVARAFGPALGVATADFNGDRWIDIFVANDQRENQLWINQRDLKAEIRSTEGCGVTAGTGTNDDYLDRGHRQDNLQHL